LVIGSASPALAATIDPAARTAAEAAITARLTDLSARVTLINSSPALTAGDKSALLSEITSTTSGLQTLATTIANETSVAAFRTEVAGIYSNFRVYALVLPQVHLVRATDELATVVVPALQKVEQALQARAAGVAAAVAPLNDLAAQIAAIQTDTGGLSATLLAVTPAQWNASHTVLSGPRQKLEAARKAAGQALDDVKAVRAVIK
jgi:hypothetical protein